MKVGLMYNLFAVTALLLKQCNL